MAEVVPILAPYKVASREVKPEPTVVRAGSLAVGNSHLGVIAGPCSVENEEQMLSHRPGREGRRGHGPPRRGLQAADQPVQLPGPEGRRAEDSRRRPRGNRPGRRHRSASPKRDVELVAQYADVLQIGARNMQNYRLLEAVGDAGKPVLLKRGASATMDELLLAAEYILNAGNPNVMLCERGIRTFETHTRYTLPLSASVPYLHERTHLPVVVDPSHGTGHTNLVTPMAAAAVAAGADGLIVEVHPDPETALSDGYQSLDFPQFEETDDALPPRGRSGGPEDRAERVRSGKRQRGLVIRPRECVEWIVGT